MSYIDTKVVVPGTRGHGILRYHGPIRGKNGTFGGIELIGPIAASRGKNSGDVDGIRYFQVEQPMTGLFLPFERLKAANPHLQEPGSNEGRTSRNSGSSSPSEGFRSLNASAGSANGSSAIGNKRSSIGSRLSASMKGVLSPSGYINQSAPLPKQRRGGGDRRSVSGGASVPVGSDSPELNELKAIHVRLLQEMAEKTLILNELRNTVNELQPLLEEYETESGEKDKKLAKQKADFENAREEWRESIDLMSAAHQENEAYYEKQISVINDRLMELAQEADESSKSKESSEEEIAKLNLQVDDLQMEKIMIEKRFQVQLDGKDIEIRILHEKLASQVNNTPIEDSKEKELYDAQIKSKDEEIEQLQEQISQVEASVERLHQKLEQKEFEVSELETKLAYKESELESVIEKNLVERVKEVNLETTQDNDDLAKKVRALEEQLKEKNGLEQAVDDLKHELSIRPTFNELVDLQTSLDELETLHKKELNSTEEELRRVIKENKDLQQKLEDVLTEQVESAKEEAANRSNSELLVDGNLPIYSPVKSDPSAGKNDWCGLCERDGHSSINCPYENDIF